MDIVLIKKEHCRFLRYVKAIPGTFLHVLAVADIDKKKIRNVVRNTCAERIKKSFLKDVKIRKRF